MYGGWIFCFRSVVVGEVGLVRCSVFFRYSVCGIVFIFIRFFSSLFGVGGFEVVGRVFVNLGMLE